MDTFCYPDVGDYFVFLNYEGWGVWLDDEEHGAWVWFEGLGCAVFIWNRDTTYTDDAVYIDGVLDLS